MCVRKEQLSQINIRTVPRHVISLCFMQNFYSPRNAVGKRPLSKDPNSTTLGSLISCRRLVHAVFGLVCKQSIKSITSAPRLILIGTHDLEPQWNWEKKLERAFKIAFRGADAGGLSATEPDGYFLRWRDKTFVRTSSALKFST